MTKIETILANLAKQPGATAREIGATPVEMGRLVKAGAVVDLGPRSTGKRGRPPHEFALPGSEKAKTTNESVFIPAPLPDVSHLKFNDEHTRQITFIQRTFTGERGSREKGDYDMLRERFNVIVKAAERGDAWVVGR